MKLKEIREMYPEGTQIVLTEMAGESQMPYGLKGTVKFVDDAGQIHMSWENGSSLALNIHEDTFEKVEAPEKISVILVEPGRYPKLIEIEDTLEAMQSLVEGDIEEYMPFEDEVAIICNDEGMNCGLFKTYRVGNEYRASKKSVEENKKIVKAVLTYQDKKTMSVPDVMRILGLGKTATYRLINQCRFKTYLVLGKMRVDVDSFEDWYAGQFHYEKVNGERPGKKYGKTLSPLTIAKVLGIPRSTANDLMNDGIVEFIWVDGKRRIKRESFDKWYASQSKYTKVKEIEEVEGYVD